MRKGTKKKQSQYSQIDHLPQALTHSYTVDQMEAQTTITQHQAHHRTFTLKYTHKRTHKYLHVCITCKAVIANNTRYVVPLYYQT